MREPSQKEVPRWGKHLTVLLKRINLAAGSIFGDDVVVTESLRTAISTDKIVGP